MALPPPQGVAYHGWWILVSTIVMGVGIGVLAQPQLIVRFMTVNSKQALNRAVAAGGFFILCMTGVAFTVGALSNVYFAKHESIHCQIVNDHALLDPGADGKGKLAIVSADAPGEIVSRSKRFVSYRLPDDAPDALTTFLTDKWKSSEIRPALDVIRPFAGAERSIGPDDHAGNTDTIIPAMFAAQCPAGLAFLLTPFPPPCTMSSQFHTMGTSGPRCSRASRQQGHTKTILVTASHPGGYSPVRSWAVCAAISFWQRPSSWGLRFFIFALFVLTCFYVA